MTNTCTFLANIGRGTELCECMCFSLGNLSLRITSIRADGEENAAWNCVKAPVAGAIKDFSEKASASDKDLRDLRC